MPKYLVRHTTLLHNKKTYGEGKEIELTEEQAARIPDFVEPISEKKTSTTKTSTKSTKSDSKSESNKNSEDSDPKQILKNVVLSVLMAITARQMLKPTV